MTLTYISLFLLVGIRKNLALTFFRMPFSFLSAIYNGAILLKEAEFFQRNLKKKIEELKYNYKPKNA